MLSKSIGLCAGLCLFVGGVCGLSAARAQDSGPKVTPPPKVLQIDVENLKPGKSGAAHQKTESAFVKISQGDKSAPHYLGMQSLSGPPRALFFFSYDSYAALEKEHLAEMSGPLAGQLDSAFEADGELLTSLSSSIYTYREDLSHNAPCSISTMRYMQISRITVKPGHQPEWEEYLKMFASTLEKTEPARHVAVFQSAYGWENGGVWLIITPMKSLDEVDSADADSAKFRESMGEANMKHYHELAAATIQSGQRNLFAFDPAMSNVSDTWAGADPFWKHK
jgi:hypothetical protein